MELSFNVGLVLLKLKGSDDVRPHHSGPQEVPTIFPYLGSRECLIQFQSSEVLGWLIL